MRIMHFLLRPSLLLTMMLFALLAAPLAFAQAPFALLEPIGSMTAINVGSNPLDALDQYLQPLMPYVIGMAAGLSVILIVLVCMQIMLGVGNIASNGGKARILAAIAGL